MKKINVDKYLRKREGFFDRTWVFNSIADLDEIILIPYEENKEYSKVYKYKNECSSGRKKEGVYSSLYYFKTFEEAHDTMLHGWENGAVKLKNEIKNIKIKTNKNIKMKSEYNVIGGNVSVPRYLQGIPNNMILNKMVEKKDKILNIYKTIGYSSKYSAYTVMREAAKSVILIDMLENMGYRCNLFIVKYNVDDINKRKLQSFTFKIKIKDAKEKLNLKKISFFLSNPDFQRRIVWRLFELHPDYTKKFYAYGSTVDYHCNTLQDYYKYYSEVFDFKKNDIILPIIIDNIDEFIKSIMERK